MNDYTRNKTAIDNKLQRTAAGIKYHRIYVAIALPLLIALCFITGPFQVPDEPSHFFRSIQLSHGEIRPLLGPAGNSAGGLVDTSANTLVEKFGRNSFNWDPSHRFVFGDLVASLHIERGADPLSFVAFSNTAIYFPIAHMLPALSIALARQVGAPPLSWLYIGRLTNALAAIIVSVFAIALFEESGLYALILCCLPMVLFEEASLSADALVIPFAVLLASLVARIARDTTFGLKFYIALLICLLYVSVAKFAYVPLVLLPPSIAIIQKKDFWTIVLVSAISFFILAIWSIWSIVVHNEVFTIYVHTGVVDVHQQLQNILKSPEIFVKVIFETTFHLNESKDLIEQMVGSRLGWQDVRMPKLIVDLCLVILFVAAVFRGPSIQLQITSRLVAILLLFGSAVAVYLLLYLQFTVVGARTVDGMQGRYLIPLMAFLPLVIPGWQASHRWGLKISILLLLASEIAGLATTVRVWSAYWGQP